MSAAAPWTSSARPSKCANCLRSTQVKTIADWEGGAAISILPDKAKQRSEDPAVRCAASIQATVRLDLGSFFPRTIEGKVVGDGCEQRGAPLLQYGGQAIAHALHLPQGRLVPHGVPAPEG